MLPEVKAQFELLKKLSSVKLNNSLIASLDRKIQHDLSNRSLLGVKEQLCRKSGDILSAIEIANMLSGKDVANIIRSGGRRIYNYSSQPQDDDKNYRSCPLFVVDDFLPQNICRELLTYVKENEQLFHESNIGTDVQAYVPEKRRTKALHSTNGFERNFTDFLDANRLQICEALELSPFDITRIEVKFTNHVDGGFFHIHSDNKDRDAKKGRTISWLYYFHERPTNFRGGDLLVFDTSSDAGFYDLGAFTRVAPIHNRFVAFPSYYYHGVTPVTMNDNVFGNGRMALGGHVHRER